MINIPIDARVECTDGPYGTSTHVITDPTTGQDVYFIVQEEKEGKRNVVSANVIKQTTTELIQLNCTKEELMNMEHYIEAQFVPGEGSEAEERRVLYLPYAVPAEPITEKSDSLPSDQLDVRRGAEVEATDGNVGKIDEFLVEPLSGNFTHIVVREGRLWGKRDLTLPVTAIDRVAEGKVYLKLDKERVKALPAIPVKRSYSYQDAKVELIVMVFDEMDKADEALDFLKDLSKQVSIGKVMNAATLVKDEEGEVSLSEMDDIDPRRGAIFGAVTGGLVGLLGGPVGVVVGAAAGAAAGRAAARRIDMGFSNKYLKAVQDRLQPGSSALIALVEHEWRETVASELGRFGGQLFRQALTDEIISQYLQEPQENEQE